MTLSPTRPFAPGARVGGKYVIVRLLASGGMGDVWLAKNLATGGPVAVKRCRADIPGDEASERFRYEARLGAMLSHRGIVRVFDLVEEAGGPPSLVMELLRGESLEQRLAVRGHLEAPEAIAIAVALLAALTHAHEHGILHRDVTPANVFLAIDSDGHVTPKLVDFGLAKLPASGVQTTDGRVLGTPRYMAPERIRGAANVDARSDIFSVGVVLFEMLTGTCPFAASTPAASLAAVLEAVVDPDPRIPPRVWIEVQRALAKRPYERHANARELIAALEAASGETEAGLAERLRGAPPPDIVSLQAQMAADVDERSSGGTRGDLTPRARIFRWLAIPTLALFSLAATAVVHRPSRHVEPVALAIPVAAPQPPPSAASAAPSSAAPALVPVSASAGPRPPLHPSRPRPIATSPGF
jgi:eukaryotic-like serine/threonine-protein kinase